MNAQELKTLIITLSYSKTEMLEYAKLKNQH